MTTPAQKKLSTAMSQVMTEGNVVDGLTKIGSVHSAVVAAVFNLTIEQMNELNIAMATLIGQAIRNARGKGIQA